MPEEPESLTVRLLREMRSEMQDLRSDMQNMRLEMHEMRTDLTQRIDGNTMILNLVAGVAHDHEQRITTLEAK